jgi:predicted ester cyclase
MVEEHNKRVRQQWLDCINARDIDTAIELLHPEFVSHAPGRSDVEGVREWFNMLFAAFPDMHSTTLVLFADGDKVVHYIRVEGTHNGTFMGIPSTGKHAVWTLIDILRFADGKMIEHWNETDSIGMMQQLGLIPA